MLDTANKNTLFHVYYSQWVNIYKEGAIRNVTLAKYRLTEAWLRRLIPELRIADMTRINYQKLLNDYAETHERQTTMDFHHQLKAAILDAVDEGLILRPDKKRTRMPRDFSRRQGEVPQACWRQVKGLQRSRRGKEPARCPVFIRD